MSHKYTGQAVTERLFVGTIALPIAPVHYMSPPDFPKLLAQPSLAENFYHFQTFAGAIAHIKTLALQAFDREVADKQLYYHTHEHIEGVQRRASQIFQVIRPWLPLSDDLDRLELLLDLCAVAHDLIQIFTPQVEPHTARRREAGVSEAATIERLLKYINLLNERCLNCSNLLSEGDLKIIQEAIAATVCHYDPIDQTIFQPALFDREFPISPVARILALADVGSLGMEGIEAFNREGTLLFLEENPDVRSFVKHRKLESLISEYPDLHESIRQRLLRRARFQVNFAKSRLKRFPQEVEGFPSPAIAILRQEIFQYLTPETIAAIESNTPTAEDTSLEELTNFFQLEQAIEEMSI